MSETQLAQQLDELLAQYRSTKPPVKAQKSYCSTWLSLVRSSGLTEQTCALLHSGSKFHAADAFADFWEESADPPALVRQLTEYPAQAATVRSQQLAAQLRVLAHLLNRGASADQISLLIRSVTRLARKTGGYIQFAETRVREDLAGVLNAKTALPDYEAVGLEASERDAFARMLADLMPDAGGKTWTAAKQHARERLLAWTSLSASTPASAAPPVLPSQSRSGDFERAVAALQDLVPYLRELEQNAAQAAATPAAGTQSADPALQRRIRDLEAQLAAKEQLIDVMDRDNQAVSVDRTEALEEALGREYEDFQGAEDLPMSEMLGENLRDQLAKVFSLLREHGLHF